MRNGDAGNRAGMPDYSSGKRGRNPQGPVVVASRLAARREDSIQKTQTLMEAVVERENMFKALRQVEKNKGHTGSGWNNSTKVSEAACVKESSWVGSASKKNCWREDTSRSLC